MHIDRLKLEQFRGARELSLNLDASLNVFVGMNGAGKSSVLDASAILLTWLVNRIRSSSASGRQILESDIQGTAGFSCLEIAVTARDRSYSWSLCKMRPGGNGYLLNKQPPPRSTLLAATELAGQMQADISEGQEGVDLPLFVYYPVNRAVLDIPLRIRKKHQFSLLAAYQDALTSGANFRTFFEWFRETEDLENEQKIDLDNVGAPQGAIRYQDPQLKAVRTALSQFMPEFVNWRVRRNPLRMEVDKSGKRLTVNQLSDGEKCLMAMIGDLARRLAIANPVRDNPLEGEGVILIDEIDLHLHPKWQRMLFPRLTEVFPNCQFLISTHSPHVITQVEPKNLFLLTMDDNGLSALRPAESYGKTVERVLEDLMGLETTRPDEVKQALRDIYQQIDTGALAAAREAIADLEQRIGDDPELTKAGVLIKRKELIGK
ncbi:MAG TPA: DUF2813 domain-containing protein [Chromatiaceae bacterium]|nr:MAG: hypothetical protein N838_09520 [Thiohalocapsa sp. PB-PSB1]QQO52067.1 MAG: AAA family ATPase [Thiohalocapsa sp. PB-PSB1]HBG94434.1 DUF2813 domain-containing protein [Chromatiaceae bacterium]HCS91584.1 DUF2813 domain-containing protein [Chromatiaceae bacterium]